MCVWVWECSRARKKNERDNQNRVVYRAARPHTDHTENVYKKKNGKRQRHEQRERRPRNKMCVHNTPNITIALKLPNRVSDQSVCSHVLADHMEETHNNKNATKAHSPYKLFHYKLKNETKKHIVCVVGDWHVVARYLSRASKLVDGNCCNIRAEFEKKNNFSPLVAQFHFFNIFSRSLHWFTSFFCTF